MALANSQHVEAEKSLVAATHLLDQARSELQRIELQLSAEREEISRLNSEAEAARLRVEQSRRQHAEAVRSRAATETESSESAEKLLRMRHDFQALQERLGTGREELATMTERLTSAEAAGTKGVGGNRHRRRSVCCRCASSRRRCIRKNPSWNLLAGSSRCRPRICAKKNRVWKNNKAALETGMGNQLARAQRMLEESVRGKRQSLDELRAERSQRQIEKARNDADRDYLRQTCVAELNAQPEDLMAQEAQLLVGEDLGDGGDELQRDESPRGRHGAGEHDGAGRISRNASSAKDFLRRERDDLVAAIENTRLTITELDQVSRQKFEEAFNFINAHFAIAFQSLFGGGHGEMRLSEPDSSGEAGIDIAAQPPGKRLQNILLLSGGEKALTALALLIAVFRYQPSPFCILDEVDAPLDEANVGRFNKMLAEMCAQTQFIVVTHNRKTMEMGSVLYGVTMQEPGVSKLVSVKWEDAAVRGRAESRQQRGLTRDSSSQPCIAKTLAKQSRNCSRIHSIDRRLEIILRR